MFPLSVSANTSSSASGGTLNAGGLDFGGSSWSSPFAVGDGASASAGSDKTLLWVVGIAAVVAIGAAAYAATRK